MGVRQDPLKLPRDNHGNVLPMAAAAVLVGAVIVGGGVDMSRAYRVQNRLQLACDSAVLAGRRTVAANGFDTAAEARADAYFATNFDDGSFETHGTNFAAFSENNGQTVEGVATTTLDTALMGIVGVEDFDFSVECSASMGVGNSDVILVLDTTGSMDDPVSGSGSSQKKIVSLRAAVKNFHDTLSEATSGTNARIRYGFVPYSQSVNVGQLLYDLDPDYLVDSFPYQSRQPLFETVTEEVFDHWDDPVNSSDTDYDNFNSGSWNNNYNPMYSSNNSCLNNLPADTAWANYGSPTTSSSTYINGNGQQVQVTTTTQPQRMQNHECRRFSSNSYYRRWRYEYRDFNSNSYATSDPVYNDVENTAFKEWQYKQIVRDVSTYKTFAPVSLLIGNTGSDGEPTTVTSTWAGCIEERQTVSEASFSFSSMLGMSPTGAFDLDIDSAPDPGDDTTKWAPMWPEVAYLRYTGSGWSKTYTNNTTQTGEKATSKCPVGARLLAEMDESAYDAYVDTLTPNGNTYLDIGMIWGGRLISPDGIFADNVNEEPGNAGEVARHVIFMTDGFMQPSSTVQSSYGIERHDRRITDDGFSNQAARHTSRFLAVCNAIKAKGVRIWVIAFDAALSSDLQTCSSDNSSFTANNASELDEAFQEIAKQVGELRIIQ